MAGKLRILLVDNYPHPMEENSIRKREFTQVFLPLEPFVEWEVVHHPALRTPDGQNRALTIDGMILSGSPFMLSDETVRQEFEPIAQFLRHYPKPILGICFGHQLIAHAFGFLVRPMRPEYYHSESWEHNPVPTRLSVRPGFPLIEEESIWVEFSHHEEIVESEEFHRVFEVYASTEACRIQVIAHRQRPIYGVQFHPETGKDPRARRDGQKIFERFVRQIKSI